MPVTAKSLGIDKLDLEARLSLVEEIWASICQDAASFPLSEAQRLELEERVSEDLACPEDVASWDEVKARLLRQLQQ